MAFFNPRSLMPQRQPQASPAGASQYMRAQSSLPQAQSLGRGVSSAMGGMFGARPAPQSQAAQTMPNMGFMLSDEDSKIDKSGINWQDYALSAAKKDGGGGGGGLLGGLLGGGKGGGLMSMLSDEDSKEEIQRLKGANDALTRALGERSEPKPKTGQGQLGQTLGKGLRSIAGGGTGSIFSPTAERVARQNQALTSAPSAPLTPAPSAPPFRAGGGIALPSSPMPQPMPQQPPQMPPAAPGSPFAVGMQPPDLNALDEAYRRLGQGG